MSSRMSDSQRVRQLFVMLDTDHQPSFQNREKFRIRERSLRVCRIGIGRWFFGAGTSDSSDGRRVEREVVRIESGRNQRI